jgi:hypothetical protein
MIPALRNKYNASFQEKNYAQFLKGIDSHFPGAMSFRVAETPIFVDREFKNKMLDTCEHIIKHIKADNFINKSESAIPANLKVPGNENHPEFIAFDFGVCKNSKGELEPQLIEMQGFPTLFCYELLMDREFRNNFNIPDSLNGFLSEYNEDSYLALLKKIILNEHPAENVILLELFPHQQKTKLDFYCTEKWIGIKTVCLTELIQEGNNLFYLLNGIKTPIKRIYNRIIFDELQRQDANIIEKGRILFAPLNVEWCPHPNWFYRISKYTLPFLHHPNIPATYFLNEVKQLPTDLENYVLKPLFSFAGQGVIIDIQQKDIESINDPENWILQKKVNYADAIATPDGYAKAEIRLFYFWDKNSPNPIPIYNLGRLSKGKMIGVRYNQDKTWVGGTHCYFEN